MECIQGIAEQLWDAGPADIQYIGLQVGIGQIEYLPFS